MHYHLFTPSLLFLSLSSHFLPSFASPSPPPKSDYSLLSLSRTLDLSLPNSGSLSPDLLSFSLKPKDDQKDLTQGGEWIVDFGNEGKRVGWMEAWEGKAKDGNKKGRKIVEIKEVEGGDDSSSSTHRLLSLHLPPSSSSLSSPRHLTLSLLHSLPSTPVPKSLPQDLPPDSNEVGQFLKWEGDLMLGIPIPVIEQEEEGNESDTLEDLRIKIKTPTPKILSYSSPSSDDWDVQHTKGTSVISFNARRPENLQKKRRQRRGAGAGAGGDSDGNGHGDEEVSTEEKASIHYLHPSPIIKFKSLHRIIQLSIWSGKLNVAEKRTVVNAGPSLSGHFSRLAHQAASYLRRSQSLSHVLTSLTFFLPPKSFDPYYVDEVGNVSTSRFWNPNHQQSLSKGKGSGTVKLPSQRNKLDGDGEEKARLDIFPRYPLLGGWNYSFEIGWDDPLDRYLKYDNTKSGEGRSVLAVPFFTPLGGVMVEDVKLEVRLPDGASDIQTHLPFPVDSLTTSFAHTYLDTTKGRPTVIIEKGNCADRHGEGEVLITFSHPSTTLLQKPLLISSVFFAFFAIAMAVRRFEWVIGRNSLSPKVGSGTGRLGLIEEEEKKPIGIHPTVGGQSVGTTMGEKKGGRK